MRRSNERCQSVCRVWGLAAVALLLVGADDPKQTIDAGGLKFEAPKVWKSSPPFTQMRKAELKVDPIEGDDYPAELVVFSFGAAAGSVDANLKRWQGLFKDKDGNPPSIDSKKVKGKNVVMTRAELHGDYHPARFPGRPIEPDRANARLLGAIVTADGASYYIRMIGPDKTMTKLRPVFDELLSTVQVEANDFNEPRQRTRAARLLSSPHGSWSGGAAVSRESAQPGSSRRGVVERW